MFLKTLGIGRAGRLTLRILTPILSEKALDATWGFLVTTPTHPPKDTRRLAIYIGSIIKTPTSQRHAVKKAHAGTHERKGFRRQYSDEAE